MRCFTPSSTTNPPEVKAEMKVILDEITSGRFAEEFVSEVRSGGADFDRLRKRGAEHQIETVGKDLRAMMPWISAGKKSVSEISGGD